MGPVDSVDVSCDESKSEIGRLASRLRDIGASAGLDRVGICDASILERARVELHRRKELGLSDTMQFTYRNPDRSTDPTRTLPKAKSIVVGARHYNLDTRDAVRNDNAVDQDGVYARVAKYAQIDHYADLRRGLEEIATALRAAGHRAVVVADENNLVDREVAWRAGLGWFGKNANLLLPGAGSWFVLGSVITTANLAEHSEPVGDGCGTCRRCIDACPTGAIVADGVIDARRCLAWLVQKPGVFPEEFRIALGDRLYGCDDCQDSCPITVRLGSRLSHSDAESERELQSHEIDDVVDLLDILEFDDASLLERFGRWYIPERNPVWVRRNALINLANVAPVPLSTRVTRVLDTYLHSEDPHLRAQAVWTARRLGAGDLAAHLLSDPDPVVQDEWQRRVEQRSAGEESDA